MTEKKSWGSTVLGWFIVQDDDPASPVAASPAADADAAVIAAAAQSSPPVFQQEPPSPSGGQVPFDEVFDAAGIDADERERVSKAQQLLGSLPAETPTAVKKQIVEASLKAFGVPIDNIIETGVAEIQALEGYIRKSAGDTQQLLEEANRRIAQFEDEIRKLRRRHGTADPGAAGGCGGLQRQEAGRPAGARVLRAGGGGAGRPGVAAAARSVGAGRRSLSGRRAGTRRYEFRSTW